MADTVRVGVVGASPFTENTHILALKSHPRAEVVALCGQRKGHTEEIARKHGIPQAFTDYRRMIEGGGLEALVVSAPDDLHYPITRLALEAGLHVMCEKPLAMNAVQAREMTDSAHAKRLVNMTFYTFRWMPQYRYMKQLIEEDYLGAPYHASLRFHAAYARSGEYVWRLDARRANGVLGDIASHLIDLARWLVGEIEWVNASLAVHARPSSPEVANDTAFLNLGFRSGAQGSLIVSAASYLADQWGGRMVELYGEKGTLECYDAATGEGPTPRVVGARANEPRFATLPLPELYTGGADMTSWNWWSQILTSQPVGDRLFIDAILNGDHPAPTFEDGWRGMQVIDAAFEADRIGKKIVISDK